MSSHLVLTPGGAGGERVHPLPSAIEPHRGHADEAAPPKLHWRVERAAIEMGFASAADLCAMLEPYTGLSPAELLHRGGFQYLLALFNEGLDRAALTVSPAERSG